LKISDVVDYIVFMTYDLHGQWDWDNPNGSDGCEWQEGSAIPKDLP
jgi:chitinase